MLILLENFCIVMASPEEALCASEPCSVSFCPAPSTSWVLVSDSEKSGGQGRPCIQGNPRVVSQKEVWQGLKVNFKHLSIHFEVFFPW